MFCIALVYNMAYLSLIYFMLFFSIDQKDLTDFLEQKIYFVSYKSEIIIFSDVLFHIVHVYNLL